MNKSASSILAILLLFLIVVFVNGVSRVIFGSFYWDLTEEGLYSLSEGTKSVVNNLDSKVTLRFYFSKSLSADAPAIKLYGQRISDLLAEYNRIGGDNLRVEFIDPQPDSEDEEWAQRYGITPMNTPSGNQLFLGLAGTNQQAKEEVIPLFNLSRQETLEYDITKLVLSLGRPEKKKIGVISSLPIEGDLNPQQPRMPGQPFGAQPWAFVGQLKTFADVVFLSVDTAEISEDIKSLMVIHPKNLSESTIYAIDQFLMRGGNLFLAVDPFSQADPERADPSNPMSMTEVSKSSNLEKLLSAWGVTLEQGAVGDKLLATQVNAGRGYAENFPLFISSQELQGVEGDNIINRENVMTNDLEVVLFPWVGSLLIENREGIVSEPLFRSTAQSMLIEPTQYELGGGDPSAISKSFKPSDKQYILAALLKGKLKSAFPGGRPDVESSQEGSSSSGGLEHLAASEKQNHVVIVADTDFITDMYSVSVQNIFGAQFATRINDNLTFLVNVMENLSGSEELISLRSRGKFMRPFTRVQEIERQAEQRWLEEERQLEQQLEVANARLNELQRGSSSDAGELVTQAAFDEIKRFREQRVETMRRLREVRRNLRQDKQSLGNMLFLINTFAVPAILIGVATGLHFRRRRH